MEICAVRLERNLEKDSYESLLLYLPNSRQERISRFHRFEDAQRTLMGDILSRYMLCGRLGIGIRELEISADCYGKPHVLNPGNTHFNISHSGKWVVCCMDDSPVGIDIEQVKAVDISIAERFFSKSEYKLLKSKNGPEQNNLFYELWTLKESYIKAEGKGLSIPLDSFAIEALDGSITVKTDSENENWFFRQYRIDDGYKTAVCSRSANFPDQVGIIGMDAFCGLVL